MRALPAFDRDPKFAAVEAVEGDECALALKLGLVVPGVEISRCLIKQIGPTIDRQTIEPRHEEFEQKDKGLSVTRIADLGADRGCRSFDAGAGSFHFHGIAETVTAAGISSDVAARARNRRKRQIPLAGNFRQNSVKLINARRWAQIYAIGIGRARQSQKGAADQKPSKHSAIPDSVCPEVTERADGPQGRPVA